ncbi:unnamed protein product [Linum tenue]|uniref:Uncharacterized protein n=1 Tax=Linum tenue TaxID=586396 RepID=A0AAV0LT56_9ROSI|nr:unnamed protein product [Linum tenue]CAI0436724.1 unnamed protein product [Linum tenue]
MTIWVCAG